MLNVRMFGQYIWLDKAVCTFGMPNSIMSLLYMLSMILMYKKSVDQTY